jgi:hypothetical protein
MLSLIRFTIGTAFRKAPIEPGARVAVNRHRNPGPDRRIWCRLAIERVAGLPDDPAAARGRTGMLTYLEIWRSLTAAERAQACAAFLSATDEMSRQVRPAVLLALAKALRFREKFLKTQPVAKQAEWLAARAGGPAFRAHHDGFLRAWLVQEHAAMIERFLDVQGIPHTGCMLEGEPATPDADSLAKGIAAIREPWGDRCSALYLAFLLAEGAAEPWTALPAALEASGLRLAEALAVAPPA